ncbi:unnamed protein product [Phytophthora lilii]|uniref:Unnamed protein product n=1 Tax=Phytophthora lilii TaxID=2077276 RepID=A0A9W6UA19_9STRA|nr:unnamed protein product [Phytophthora lilii]
MVLLNCALVGDGSVISIIIEEWKTVALLKKEIKQENPSTITCDAKDLQLFLAKAGDNTWLSSLTEDVKKLKKGEMTALVEALTQEDKELDGEFGLDDVLEGMPEPKTKQIHVLVVVPESAVGSASETSTLAQLSAKIDDLHKQAVGKRKYVHSEVNSTQGRQLLNALNIRVEFVRTVPFAAGEGSLVAPFEWKSVAIENGEEVVLTEEQQRNRYREYVERKIVDVLKEKQLSVIGVEKARILNVEVPGHEIELTGCTDLLILSDVVTMRPSEVRYFPEVKMLIEVKKDIKPSNDFQALSELIALDLIAGDPVMALLTDLKREWLFFWVAEKKYNSARICKAAIDEPGEAFEVIKALLKQPPTAGDGAATATEITLPCFQLPVKRLKLRETLAAVGEGGGEIRESIERYYDIASFLGPDLDMARAVARQVTRSIPTLSYIS